jgi:hypothetical protein
MRRLTLRLIVALLAFIVGVAAVSLWFVLRRSNPEGNKLKVTAPAQTPNKQARTYTRGPAGLATTGSFITLNSSDGMSFTKWSVYCRTARLAQRELQKRLRKATEIVSREAVLDEGGQRIGEKIVASFSPNGPDISPATLIWTENEELFQVEGSSLQNILEYRKDFNR